MAKIRAYKLAEELGIDRHDFVEKAAEAGVELKSAMASLDEEQVAKLRAKLGATPRNVEVAERTQRRIPPRDHFEARLRAATGAGGGEGALTSIVTLPVPARVVLGGELESQLAVDLGGMTYESTYQ